MKQVFCKDCTYKGKDHLDGQHYCSVPKLSPISGKMEKPDWLEKGFCSVKNHDYNCKDFRRK